MNVKLPYKVLPEQNNFFLDYISENQKALKFFSHTPQQIKEAVALRKDVLRKELSEIIFEYNRSIEAPDPSLRNAERLREKNVFTVISGQQAGFLGGPSYTAYKIATTVNIAKILNREFPDCYFVPLFWLASEDHDFYEINHVSFMKEDGEPGLLKFGWEGKGQSIYDLFVTEEIVEHTDTYLKLFSHSHLYGRISGIITPQKGERYTAWIARIFTSLFGSEGLVIIEPQFLRPLAGRINFNIIKNYHRLREILEETNKKLQEDGYTPAISSENLDFFTYDEKGRRIKIKSPYDYMKIAKENPEFLSPGALLRPLWADSILPVSVSVVGPGELCYHGQLKDLYRFLDIPQPVIIPRQSYTFASFRETEFMKKYGIPPEEIFTHKGKLTEFFERLVPEDWKKLFKDVKDNINLEFNRFLPGLKQIDPNLVKTLERNAGSTENALDKLEYKSVKALLAKKGYSLKELKILENLLFPFGKLQERVFPIFHFLASGEGEDVESLLLKNSDFMDFRHNFVLHDF